MPVATNQAPGIQEEACIPLPKDFHLHRRYTVRQMTGFDHCTITYDGFDYVAKQPVSIIEFFPQGLAMRAISSGTVSPANRESGALFFLCSEAFLTQYSGLKQAIGSPNILSVFDAFFENGTAYAIVEPTVGLTLHEYLTMRQGPLTPGELVDITTAMGDALLIVHSLNVLHHCITPQSILICTDGTVKLIRFAAAHETLRLGRDLADQGPSVDIRSLGDTLRAAFEQQPSLQTAKQTQPTLRSQPGAFAQPAPFNQAVQPQHTGEAASHVHSAINAMLERMRTTDATSGFASVFDLRYAVSSLDVPPETPELSEGQIARFRQSQRMAREAARQASRTPVPQDKPSIPPTKRAEPSGPTVNRYLALAAMGILLLALAVTAVVLLLNR